MHKILGFILLSFFSISMAKNTAKIHELVDLIKSHPHSVTREKAIQDLKHSGIVAVATIAGGIAFYIVKKMWETPLITKKRINEHLVSVNTAIQSLPPSIFVLWLAAEVAGASYAIVKGYQGAKQLLVPQYKIDAQNTNEISAKKLPTHIRVKRENT